MFLKIIVLNNSGNVGKSVVCDVLFRPRLVGCESIKIETINNDGTNEEKLSAKDIAEIFEKINDADVCVIDVGASNIEVFIQNMKKMDGAIDDLDYFFIPCTTAVKQQQDTKETIKTLIGMGVEIDKIKVIFNYFDPEITLERQYQTLFESNLVDILELKDDKNQFCIEESQTFDLLARTGLTYSEVLNDERDFKSLIRGTKVKEERAALSLEQMAFRFVKTFDKKLDLTFDKISEGAWLNES